MTEDDKDRMRFKVAFFAFAGLIFIACYGVAKADHTHFYVVNRSPVTITHVYATSVVNRSFGQDLLGEAVIAPGARKRVVPHDNRGCLFDVAFTFYGGHVVNRRNLDLCTITTLSTTGQGVGVPNRNERPDTYRDFH